MRVKWGLLWRDTWQTLWALFLVISSIVLAPIWIPGVWLWGLKIKFVKNYMEPKS